MPFAQAFAGRAILLLTISIGVALPSGAPVQAASPQAWAAYGQQVQRACLAASNLRSPRPAGERVDLPGGGDALLSAVLVEGTYPQAHMAGRRGLELCVYEARTKQARVAEADRLMRQPRP